jgi:hypothetical protein
MKKKLLILCLAALGLSDIMDARGGGGHGGGGRGGGGHGGGHRGGGGHGGGGGSHRSGGHGGGRSAGRGSHSGSHSHSRSSSHSHSGGRGYGRGGYGRGGYGYGGWGAWGGWGWGLGLGLGFGLAANSWYTAPGYYGGTYIDNSNYNNYFYDNEALYHAESGEKVTDYSENDRKSGLKNHIEKLKTERTNLADEEQEKIDAIEKRIKELEEGLNS